MCAFSAYVSLIEPKNIKEALLDSDWISVMQEELNLLKDAKYGTWFQSPKTEQ